MVWGDPEFRFGFDKILFGNYEGFVRVLLAFQFARWSG